LVLGSPKYEIVITKNEVYIIDMIWKEYYKLKINGNKFIWNGKEYDNINLFERVKIRKI